MAKYMFTIEREEGQFQMKKLFKLGFILMLTLALVFVFAIGCAPKVDNGDDDLDGIEEELNGEEEEAEEEEEVEEEAEEEEEVEDEDEEVEDEEEEEDEED
ncbi:MAG: hypothetical protein GX878_06035 [Firmicutes bacterium]|nr:hypothetical protein [Bacillota bacterium]